jgi:hypothetical protein
MYSIPQEVTPRNPALAIDFLEDFINADGNAINSQITSPHFSKFFSGAGAYIGGKTTVEGCDLTTIGIAELGTGSTAGGQCLLMNSNVFGGYMFIDGGAIFLEWRVMIPTLSAVAEEFADQFGLFRPPFGSGSGMFFVYDRLNRGVNWNTYVKKAAGGAVIVDTGIPVTAGQWYKLRLTTSPDNGAVNFFINGVLVSASSGNNPSGADSCLISATHVKSAGLLNRNLYIDYCNFQKLFNNIR